MARMKSAFLNYQQFDEEKLKLTAMRRFASAWRSGRLIAFVGSYATSHLGYGSWDKLFTVYMEKCIALLNSVRTSNPKAAAQIPILEQILTSHQNGLTSSSFDKRTLASIVEDVADYIDGIGDHSADQIYAELERTCAKEFWLKANGNPHVVNALLRDLGIERILTTNYDLEFEKAMMLPLSTHEVIELNKKFGAGEENPNSDINRSRRTHTLTRTLPGGQSVVSDVFQRERTDRLIEFAVGSPDYEGQIFHLHGRADQPQSMVISLRDYDRLYRRSGITKLPFEHALKILFAGNPLLCVGLGMSEDELNHTLQEFVADHPRKNFAQIFILWSEPDKAKRTLLRFNWKHKLGATALFLEDWSDEGESRRTDGFTEWYEALAKITFFAQGRGRIDDPPSVETAQKTSGQQLLEFHIKSKTLVPSDDERAQHLALQVKKLSEKAGETLASFSYVSEDWRSLAQKLKIWEDGRFKTPFTLWGLAGQTQNRQTSPSNTKLSEEIVAIKGNDAFVLYAPPGNGKGLLAQSIITKFEEQVPLSRNRRAMLVNCNFAFDVDALLSGLSGFISGKSAEQCERSRIEVWENRCPHDFWHGNFEVNSLIVFNDFDRFFDRSGLPLSSEIDILCREIVARLRHNTSECHDCNSTPPQCSFVDKNRQDNKFTWVFLGTERIKRYFEMIDREGREERNRNLAAGTKSVWKPCINYTPLEARGGYKHLEQTKEAFVAAGYEPPPVAKILSYPVVSREAADRRRAFYASYLTPAALNDAGVEDIALCLDILTVMAFVGQTVEISALSYAPRVRKLKGKSHASETESEFQDRIKAGLVKLTELNLVHEIDQFPNSPEPYRYGLHRSVLAELRDRYGIPLGEAKLATAFNLSLYAAQPVDSYNPDTEIHDELGKLVDYFVGAYKDEGRAELSIADKQSIGERRQAQVSPCLRAALAVLRSYYSTAALVTIDTTGRAGDEDEDRPGPLTEHCERLERLIWASEETTKAWKQPPPRKEPPAPPFYPDDLVWLHNERGVTKMMQGDLYEARASFDEALRLSNKYVEFGKLGPNWVRISLNQLTVDFERGRLSQARSRIDSIIDAIGGHSVLHDITDHYGRGIPPEVEAGTLRTVVSRDFTHDQLLTVGITTGYRALIDYMGGRLETSRRRFLSSINILRRINEQRSYAMFSLHYASLLNSLREPTQAMICAETAIAALQASQQNDLASLGQVKEVWLAQWGRDGLPQQEHLRKLNGILEYAASADMHSIRVEARATLAHLKIKSGDFDAALEHASDAMALATRFGMSLRKIALRVLIGKILIKRGDKFSGHALLDQAIKEGDRVGYQRAVETAQDVRIEEGRLLDIPDY
jgi:tetratricopeptide (TPR) repeat protein